MSTSVKLTADSLPYDLAKDMIRDGKPRDAINQRIQVNDAVRVWSASTGWSAPREYFVKHILPVWIPAGRYVMHTYLLVPLLEDTSQQSDQAYLGGDNIEIYGNTIIYLTRDTIIAIREGTAQEKIKTVVDDYMVYRIRREDANVIVDIQL